MDSVVSDAASPRRRPARRPDRGARYSPGRRIAPARRSPPRSSWRAASASARPPSSAPSRRSRPLHTEALMTEASEGTDDLTGTPEQDHHHRGHGLRPAHARRRPGALPVRHAGPAAVLVHVGRPGARRDRRGRAGRHPPPRRTASPRWTTSRAADCRTSSPSTTSTAASCSSRRTCGRR